MIALVGMFATSVGAAETANPDDVVAAHNAARAAVGVEGLVWSPELAAIAMAYAEKMEAQHNCFGMGHNQELGPQNIGENLFGSAGSGAPPAMSGQAAVSSWLEEQPNYSYESNSCAPGQTCGHYTQVVWRNTREVGCAIATCSDDPQPGWTANQMICDYRPAGNVQGERPY